MVEQLAVNQQVVGSNPTQIAKFWMYSSVVERVTILSHLSEVRILLHPPVLLMCSLTRKVKT